MDLNICRALEIIYSTEIINLWSVKGLLGKELGSAARRQLGSRLKNGAFWKLSPSVRKDRSMRDWFVGFRKRIAPPGGEAEG
jgi:hypothetical protein